MQLSDFFQAFNLFNVTVYFVLLASMDYIGYKIAHLLNISDKFRVVFWIVGLSFFAFLWFILHFFIPFHPSFVAASLVILIIVFYFTKISYSFASLLNHKTEIFFLLICLLPFLKLLFFRVSLPPRYWDEMAYHFYSPGRLYSERSWNFESPLLHDQLDFYMMLPRSIDTFYILTFSLTKTYATAQLLHTMIYLSTILLISIFIKEKIGKAGLIVFLVTIFFFQPDILMDANTGYIDTATASLALMPLLALFHLITKPTVGHGRAAVLFSAIAAGAKYTLLSFLASIWLVALLIMLLNNWHLLRGLYRSFTVNIKKVLAELSVWGVITLIFGGYWYVKNFIVTGNPTYPFSLFCRACSTGTDKLQGWGYLDFNLENFHEIILSLFKSNSILLVIFIYCLFYAFEKIKSAHRNYAILIVGSFIVEYMLLSRVGNYTARFFYHWPILIAFILSIPYVNLFNKKAIGSTLGIVFCVTLVVIGNWFIYSNTIENELKHITDNDRWFARNKMPLETWLMPQIPHMYETVMYCGQNHEMIDIYTADPNMIWGEYGLTRVFLVNCNYKFIKLDENAEKTFSQISDSLAMFSTEGCLKDRNRNFTNPTMIEFEKLNQMIVCSREETGRFIYTKSSLSDDK